MATNRTEINIDNELYLDMLNNDYLKDTQLLFILKKTERIVSAMYLVTDQLSDEENLKKTLRKSVTDLLMDVASLGYLKFRKRNYRVPVSLYRTITLLDSAHLVGLIEKGNFDVLRTEMNNLLKEINIYKTHSSSGDISIKDKVSAKKDIIKDKIQDKGQKDEKSVSYKKDVGTVGEMSDKPKVKDDRKEKIVDLVRELKTVSVKDVAFRFQDYSEKTLQRDLVQLVKEGILRKKGERRWSKYYIE